LQISAVFTDSTPKKSAMEKVSFATQEKISRSRKKIEKIYSEISKGLEKKSMAIEMVQVKLSEAGLLIKDIEESIGINNKSLSIYE
jgi:hypothetical protein